MRHVNRRISVQAGPGINERPYLKSNQSKKAGSVAQVVELLLSKCKALSSNPTVIKTIKS
jgi:hypothetical protein